MVDREEGESSGHSERWECRKGRLTGRVEMGRVPNRNDYAARSLGSWKAAEVFIVSEEREQNETLTSKARDRERVTREPSGHGEDDAETSLSLSRLHARLQGRRGRHGSASEQDFEAETPGHVWFLDRRNAIYQGCH